MEQPICYEYPFCDHNHPDDNEKYKNTIKQLQNEIEYLRKLSLEERNKSLENMNSLRKEYFEILESTKREYQEQLSIDQEEINFIKQEQIARFEAEVSKQEQAERDRYEAELKKQEEYKLDLEKQSQLLNSIASKTTFEPIVEPVKKAIKIKFKLPSETSEQVKKTPIARKLSTPAKISKPVSKVVKPVGKVIKKPIPVKKTIPVKKVK